METHINSDPFLRPEHRQGSSAWLEHRKNYIGASDAAAIMGVSPFMTSYQLWEQKVGLAPPTKVNYAMQRGTDMEPEARAAFEAETGFEVFPQVVYHTDYDFLMASMDGISLDGKVAVEIKCPGKKTHDSALSGKVPPYYEVQNQHQLACTGLEMIYYYSYHPESQAMIEVHRDEEYITRMIETEKEFWDCVNSFTAPALTDRDYHLVENDVWCRYGKRIISIDAEIDALKREREDAKAILVGEADGHSARGNGITLSRSFPRGRIDYTKVPELEGLDLDPYRENPKERWTLRYKK